MIPFSIDIPTYHRNDLLARCLRTLAPSAQTVSSAEYEVIVTDDGRARTAEALIREQFPWARWVQGPQKGPAANRNNGAKHTTAPWLVFLDDDVVPKPDWLVAYVSAARDGVDVYAGKTTCEAGSRPVLEESPINLSGGKLWSCIMMVRRSRFEAMGGFDEGFPFPAMEDIDFYERIREANTPIEFVPAAVVDHAPRPRRLRFTAGRIWESRVFFIFKHRERPSVLTWLPIHILKIRQREMLDLGLRRETFVAAWSLVREWLYVVFHIGTWQKRYRGQLQ